MGSNKGVNFSDEHTIQISDHWPILPIPGHERGKTLMTLKMQGGLTGKILHTDLEKKKIRQAGDPPTQIRQLYDIISINSVIIFLVQCDHGTYNMQDNTETAVCAASIITEPCLTFNWPLKNTGDVELHPIPVHFTKKPTLWGSSQWLTLQPISSGSSSICTHCWIVCFGLPLVPVSTECWMIGWLWVLSCRWGCHWGGQRWCTRERLIRERMVGQLITLQGLKVSDDIFFNLNPWSG